MESTYLYVLCPLACSYLNGRSSRRAAAWFAGTRYNFFQMHHTCSCTWCQVTFFVEWPFHPKHLFSSRALISWINRQWSKCFEMHFTISSRSDYYSLTVATMNDDLRKKNDWIFASACTLQGAVGASGTPVRIVTRVCLVRHNIQQLLDNEECKQVSPHWLW
jgi:hypothetical protein